MDDFSTINHRVWQVVAMIPTGKVATYGDIARQAGLPRGARRVGAALRQLPAGSRLPWHRVVNAQGRVSLPTTSPSHALQLDRLLAEGITMAAGQRINLREYRWNPAADNVSRAQCQATEPT